MSLLGAELCVWSVKKLSGTNYDIDCDGFERIEKLKFNTQMMFLLTILGDSCNVYTGLNAFC